jgi:hypothetical protein
MAACLTAVKSHILSLTLLVKLVQKFVAAMASAVPEKRPLAVRRIVVTAATVFVIPLLNTHIIVIKIVAGSAVQTIANAMGMAAAASVLI